MEGKEFDHKRNSYQHRFVSIIVCCYFSWQSSYFAKAQLVVETYCGNSVVEPFPKVNKNFE